MWHDYVFYETDESFDYPTGYGYDTCYQKGQHGISIDYDADDNVMNWQGMGDFWKVDEIKTLEELYKYVLSVRDEHDNPELIDELLGFIAETERKENGKKIATS